MRGTLVDHVVALNNWLQRSPEGNVTHELSWSYTQRGPNNQAVHRATAMSRYNMAQRNAKLAKHAFATVRGVSLGEGEGVAKNRAKSAAAEKALDHLKEKGLPQQQQQQD